MSPILLASHNAGKRDEILRVLGAPAGSILTPSEVGEGSPHPVEDADDYFGNATIKAQAFADWSGLPCLADDSGLEVSALGNAPGVHSARFAGPEANDRANLTLLLERLEGVADRAARFVCCLVACDSKGASFTVSGECPGSITTEPHGDGGFGYDPVFVPDGHARTFAQMNAREKDALSHRGRALEALAAATRDGSFPFPFGTS